MRHCSNFQISAVGPLPRGILLTATVHLRQKARKPLSINGFARLRTDRNHPTVRPCMRRTWREAGTWKGPTGGRSGAAHWGSCGSIAGSPNGVWLTLRGSTRRPSRRTSAAGRRSAPRISTRSCGLSDCRREPGRRLSGTLNGLTGWPIGESAPPSGALRVLRWRLGRAASGVRTIEISTGGSRGLQRLRGANASGLWKASWSSCCVRWPGEGRSWRAARMTSSGDDDIHLVTLFSADRVLVYDAGKPRTARCIVSTGDLVPFSVSMSFGSGVPEMLSHNTT